MSDAHTTRETINIPPEFPAIKDFRVLSPVERVASRLAFALLLLIASILIAIIADWFVHRPPQPTITGLKLEDQKLAIDNFKNLSDVVWNRTSSMFDLVVIKALLPIFATVVGYLLGKRES